MDWKCIKGDKYWYRKDVYTCVLCGIEESYRQRVYKKEDSGIIYHDTACNNHF